MEMCGACKGIIAVLILLAGVVLYMGYGVAGMTALQLAGILFVLVALGKLFHLANLCPMCSAPMKKGK